MKYAKATRTLAYALAVMCLLTVFSGFICMKNAKSGRKEALEAYELLNEQTASARKLAKALELDETQYNLNDEELQKLIDKHEGDSSDYKSDLAVFTATKAGIEMGWDAMGGGITAMSEAWDQYYSGEKELDAAEAEFNAGYEQYLQGKQALEDAWAQYYAAEEAAKSIDADAVRAQIAEQRASIAAEEAELAESKAKYQERNNSGELSEEDAAEIAEIDAQIAQLEARYAELSSQASSTQSVVDRLTALLSGAASTILEGGDLSAQLSSALSSLSGINSEQVTIAAEIEALKARRLTIANNNGGDSLIISTMEANIDQKQKELESQKALLDQYESQLDALNNLDSARAQLEEAQAVMDENESAILEGKKMFEDARAQLADGKKVLIEAENQLAGGLGMLAAEEDKLNETESELKARKDALENDIANIEELTNSLESYEDRVALYAKVKDLLMDNEDVAEGVDKGFNVIESAEKAVDTARERIDTNFSGRILVAIMLLITALSAVPSVFSVLSEKKLPGVWRFGAICAFFAVLCLVVGLFKGFGIMYSALLLFIAALPLTILNAKNS